MKETLINNMFLETIRTYRTTFTWTGEGVENIVFEGLTHQYLLRTNIIDKRIKDYYVTYTLGLLTPSEIDKLPRDYYSNIFSLALAPFPFVILGAYHSRVNLYNKVKSLIRYKNKIKINGNNNFNNFFDFKDYFSEYAVGFRDGINDFENDKITPYLLKFETNNKEAFAIKVFEFLTNSRTEAPMTTSMQNFTLCRKDRWEIINAYNDGLLEGYIYRAWSIIFANNALFVKMFKDYIVGNERNERDVKDKLKISQIALKYVYENLVVTRENCNSEIKKFGHTSGESLYQKFTYYSSRVNRKGIPSNCTAKKLQNKIKLIESVIKILPDTCKQQAIDEVNILKTLAEEKGY